jgi:hypothetical protein
MMAGIKFDLEDWLVEFSCRIIEIVELLASTRSEIYIGGVK